VGEYNTMFDTVSSVLAPSEYRSAMRDIIVYDEAKVRWFRKESSAPALRYFQFH
jgi:hypothetical protein